MNKFASIPTKYNGINFRSRLEARWAVMFDLLKWEWEYEPFDLNGWIPDFKIKGNKDILVEIKPYGVFNPYPEIDDKWIEQMSKISTADPDCPVLLLSNSPIDNEANQLNGCFGLMYEKWDGEWTLDESSLNELVLAWGVNPFLVENLPSKFKPDYCVKGTTDVMLEEASKERLTEYWNTAGNETQWKRKRS